MCLIVHVEVRHSLTDAMWILEIELGFGSRCLCPLSLLSDPSLSVYRSVFRS